LGFASLTIREQQLRLATGLGYKLDEKFTGVRRQRL
jgi:hypothetical protein